MNYSVDWDGLGEKTSDSALLEDAFEVLERHGVDEGLRETILDMLARWEDEK